MIARTKPDYLQNLDLSLADAQLAIASEYGFDTWQKTLAQNMIQYDTDFECAINHLLVT